MKWISLTLLFIFILVGCGVVKYSTIDSNKAMELINNGAYVIDVRNEDEYNTGHIKDSINIPIDTIDKINIDKNENIIVYCASGVRSMKASEILYEMGYLNIYNLDGGLINWGFELE